MTQENEKMKAKEIMAGCALLAGATCAYQVGDCVGGFKVTAITPVPEVKGTLVRMTYPKNGAELAWLDRDDDNMTFSIAFRTIPQDDTGVAHILEHSVLCGSEKYPVKEPFVELLKSSFATFLNAWTSSDYTAYPVCSRNRKDFLNLVDVYMDAVLHPLSVKSPLPFRQEGWHWDLEGPDAELGRNGVVYSEMKGAFANPERLLYHELRRMLFPDNTYRFVSGGDPARIPDLTFEKYKEFYFRHYHPSNARIFLDGRVDLPAVLAKLDAYLAPYGRQAVDATVPFQKPVSASKTIAYELAPGEDTTNKTLVADAWVFAPWKDRERDLAFDVLSDALADSNEAPLSKALLSRGLCEDVAIWGGGNEQRAATFYAKNVKDGKADEVRRVMRETLEGLAANGLDHARIAAILDRHEFREREKDTGDTPRGLAYFQDAIEAWMYGGDPTEAFRHAHLYASLRAKLKAGWFEKLLREAVLDNPHHVQLTMTPSATLAAERAAAEKKELASIKAGWSKEKLGEVNDFFSVGYGLALFLDFRTVSDIDDIQQIASVAYLFLSKAIKKEDNMSLPAYRSRTFLLKDHSEALGYTLGEVMDEPADYFGLMGAMYQFKKRDTLYKMEYADLTVVTAFQTLPEFLSRKKEFEDMIDSGFFGQGRTRADIVREGREMHDKLVKHLEERVLEEGDIDF